MQGGVIHTLDAAQYSAALAALAATAPAGTAIAAAGANRGRFGRLLITKTFSFDRFVWFNGGTVAGNLDCGIYDAAGNLVKSTGSTAQGTANLKQITSVSPFTLAPGTYLIGISSDSTTAQVLMTTFTPNQLATLFALFLQTSVFPLPSTVTFNSLSLAYQILGVVEEGFPLI